MQRARTKIRNGTAAVLLAVLFIYLCAYLGGVMVLRSQVNHRVAELFGMAESHRATGSLWPFGLGVVADNIDYADATGGTRHVGRSQVILPFLMPWRVESVLTDSSYTNAQLHAVMPRVTIDAPLYARHLAQTTAVATDLSVWPYGAAETSETALRVARLTFDLTRRLDGHDAAAPEEAYDIMLTPVLLPAPQGINGGQPLTLDHLSLHATVEPALPTAMTNAAVSEWKAADGTITLDPLELDALGTKSVLVGPVTLDEALAPEGKLTLTFTGLDKAYVAMGGWNMVSPEQYQALGNLLKLMPGAGSKPFDFPVALHDRTLFFMDGAVLQLQPLPWHN